VLLAIDTSTTWTGLACYDAHGSLGECAWQSGGSHTSQLLPQLTLLLGHMGRRRDQISAIGVALGPGSWSGLQVGMSTAKGLALAGGLPIVGVGTLAALAYQHERRSTTVVPLIRLGHQRFATTGVGPREPRIVTLAELCAEINGRALFCGDIDLEVREALRLKLGDRAQFPTPAANLRRPSYLAELAWRRLQDGEDDDLTTLEPIYLGRPAQAKT
jgi:tRNA threonylcarbamoyladenosine biosynthesis protein TsaB